MAVWACPECTASRFPVRKVSVSRGAFDAQLFTNDREQLPWTLGHDVSKQTAQALQINTEQTLTLQQEVGNSSTARVLESASRTPACPG